MPAQLEDFRREQRSACLGTRSRLAGCCGLEPLTPRQGSRATVRGGEGPLRFAFAGPWTVANMCMFDHTVKRGVFRRRTEFRVLSRAAVEACGREPD